RKLDVLTIGRGPALPEVIAPAHDTAPVEAAGPGKKAVAAVALIESEGVHGFTGEVRSVDAPTGARGVRPDEECSFDRTDHQHYFTVSPGLRFRLCFGMRVSARFSAGPSERFSERFNESHGSLRGDVANQTGVRTVRIVSRQRHDTIRTALLRLYFLTARPVTRPSVLCAKRMPYTPSVDLSLPGATSSALV